MGEQIYMGEGSFPPGNCENYINVWKWNFKVFMWLNIADLKKNEYSIYKAAAHVTTQYTLQV